MIPRDDAGLGRKFCCGGWRGGERGREGCAVFCFFVLIILVLLLVRPLFVGGSSPICSAPRSGGTRAVVGVGGRAMDRRSPRRRPRIPGGSRGKRWFVRRGRRLVWRERGETPAQPIGRGAGRSSGGMWDDRLLLGRDPNANEMKNRGPSHPPPSPFPPHRASRFTADIEASGWAGTVTKQVDLGLSGGAHHRRGGSRRRIPS